MGVTPVAQNNNEAQSSDTKYTPRPIADPLGPIETGSRALFVLKEKIDRMLLVTRIQLSLPSLAKYQFFL